MCRSHPRLLTELRTYWASFKPTDFLFPGKTPTHPLMEQSSRSAANGSSHGSHHQTCDTSHLEALLRDWPARSRCGSDGYQQAAGTQLLLNYDDLSTLSAGTLGPNAQPSRLAAHAPVPTVIDPTLAKDDQAKSNQAKELPNHQRN